MALTLFPPPSQAYRQIGFYLEGGPDSAQSIKLDLAIRPEDLTVSEPSRLVVQQTLGGAFADSFDRGLVNISLAGTLGWRGSLFTSGEDAFAALRETVFIAWHQRRADAIAQAVDPSEVRLTFVDTLDNITYLVAPQSFTLRRSKSSPLLMRYQIRLVVLDDADAPGGLLDKIIGALSNPLRFIAGVTGLGAIGGTLSGYLSQGLALYGAATSAVRSVVSTISNVFNAISSIAGSIKGVFTGSNAELLTVGRAIAQAGANGLLALSVDDTLPIDQLIPAARLPALLTDADCTMANSFSLGQQYASYDDLFGASTCSSTGGAEPISLFTSKGVNPFDTYFPTETPAVLVSTAAAASMKALSGDPLLLLGQDALIVHHLNTIAAGVSVP